MTIDTLLVELFTEELPPKALKKLGEALPPKSFAAWKSMTFWSATLKDRYLRPRAGLRFKSLTCAICPRRKKFKLN